MAFLYRDLNTYLREIFGERVQRVCIDAGFDCPNRDGSISKGGCIYCSGRGSAAGFIKTGQTVQNQLEQGIKSALERYKAQKYIAYFQAFTNTYLSNEKLKNKNAKDIKKSSERKSITLAKELKKVYQPALEREDVVGLAIGTRPDCLPEEVRDMLLAISRDKLVWLELGLQSAHDKTLKKINRGHTYGDFEKAVRSVQTARTKDHMLEIVGHIIVGLPGETRDMILETARTVAQLGLDGIKIHLLHIVKGTRLHKLYERGEVDVLDQEEYIDLVCDVLEILPPTTVIHRLTGEAAAAELVAPTWAMDKAKVIAGIKFELINRNSHQGFRFRLPV